MNRHIRLSLLLSLMLMIATACNPDEPPADEPESPSEDEEEIGREQSEGEALDPEAVLENSVEAMSEVQSFSMNMITEQDIIFDDQTISTVTEADTDVTNDPFAYYEQATISEDSGNEEFEMETYFTDDGFYTYAESLDNWVRLPEQMSEDIRDLSSLQQNPEQQLEMLTEQLDTNSLEMEENDGQYIITVDGDEAGIEEVTTSIIEDLDGGFGMMVDDIMSIIDINDVSYEILIDSEDFYYEAFNMYIEANIDLGEGQAVASEQSISSVYASFNETDEITIPEEIRQNADEIEQDFDAEVDPGDTSEEDGEA